MKKAMITVCGDFGNRHWVCDQLLTTIAKLSQHLAKQGVEVVYADSMDNAQMSEPYEKGLEIEARWANEGLGGAGGVDYLFVLYWPCSGILSGCKGHPWLRMFTHLRNLLNKDKPLFLVDVRNDQLSMATKAINDELLEQKGIVLLRGDEIDGLTV